MADEPTTPTAVTEQPPTEEHIPGEESLGDPGKRALDAMKAARNTARDEAMQAKAQLEALQAQIAGKESEHAAQVERERIQAEAIATANDRIKRAEVRAAAAGKLADPADALHYINLSDLEVSEDGATDTATIAALIDDLIKTKPYLAASTAPKFGSADAGVRNGTVQSLPAAIEAATKAGNHALAISLKRQLSVENANH